MQIIKDLMLETYRECVSNLGPTNALTVQLKSLMIRHLKMNVEISNLAKGGDGISVKSIASNTVAGSSTRREIRPKSKQGLSQRQSLVVGVSAPEKAEVLNDAVTDAKVLFDPTDLASIAEMTPEQLLEKMPVASVRNLSVELGFSINKNKSDANFVKDFIDNVKQALAAQATQGTTTHEPPAGTEEGTADAI